MNERKVQDRRKIERRGGKRGVTVRISDTNPDDVKRVKRGKHVRAADPKAQA